MTIAAPRLILACACALSALWCAVPLPAQTVLPSVGRATDELDPSELYLNAYRLCREAESLAVQQNYSEAIRKGIDAERVLARIVRDFPTWKSNIVATRRNLLAKNLEEYRRKAQEAPIPTGRQPGRSLERVPDAIERHSDAPALPTYEEWVAMRQSGDQQVRQREPKMSISVRPSPAPASSSLTSVGYDQLYEELQKTRVELQTVVKAFKDTRNELDRTKRALIVAEDKQKTHRAEYEKLRDQIAVERAAGNQVVNTLTERLTQMEEAYRLSETQRKAAEEQVAELQSKLAATEASLAEVTKERDALAQECRQLRAIVELNSPEKTKALLDQNMTLASQLKAAQDRIAALEAEAAAGADQTGLLQKSLDESRAEVGRLREELAALYDENMGYRRRISELTSKLTNLEADLENSANDPKLDPALAEENKLLREIVAKQRRTLSTQQQGRQLLIETYASLKQQDPAMVEALKHVEEESTMDLTTAEKNLIEAVAGNSGESEPPNADDNKAALADMAKKAGDAIRDTLELEALGKGAESAFAKGRYGAAEQLYSTLLDKRPDHLPSLVNMGTILLQRNKPAEAIETFRRAIALAPRMPVPYYLCGSAMYRAGQDTEAAAMFRKSIELDPAHADSFFYLGNLEGLQGETDAALAHLAAAVRLNPALADAHYNMARLYAEAGHIPDACRAYDRAMQAGASPDPEFEQFLRSHPDRLLKPGVDLVATENDSPQKQEAATSGSSHGESADSNMAKAASASNAPGEKSSDAAPGGKPSVPGARTSTVNPEWGIPDTRAETERRPQFKTVKVKTKRGRRILRQKLRLPNRLREKGGSDYLLNVPAPAPTSGKNRK